MAEMKKLVVESDVTLAYFADQVHPKRILIDTETTGKFGTRITNEIAYEIGFPNDAEFDEFWQKIEELRQQGLRTEEGVPDITRQIRLRITVEVL